MNRWAAPLLWGAGIYASLWLAAAALWTSYDAVAPSLLVLAPLSLGGAFAAGWFQPTNGRTALVTGAGAVITAAIVAAAGVTAGAARMPVEPVTLAASVLLASPAIVVVSGLAHRIRRGHACRAQP